MNREKIKNIKVFYINKKIELFIFNHDSMATICNRVITYYYFIHIAS